MEYQQLCRLLQNVPSVDGRRPLAKIAEQTDGFSGSDLFELCSRAAVAAIQGELDTRCGDPPSLPPILHPPPVVCVKVPPACTESGVFRFDCEPGGEYHGRYRVTTDGLAVDCAGKTALPVHLPSDQRSSHQSAPWK